MKLPAGIVRVDDGDEILPRLRQRRFDARIDAIAGVVVAVLLGAVNRWLVMSKFLRHLQSRSLEAVAAQRLFALVLQMESIVLMAVLFAAAVLSQSAPPALS